MRAPLLSKVRLFVLNLRLVQTKTLPLSGQSFWKRDISLLLRQRSSAAVVKHHLRENTGNKSGNACHH